MMRTLSKIKNKLNNTIEWISYDKSILRKNKQLCNVSRGKKAFVLATGPSVKQQDLSKLKGFDCFSISNFFLHEQITQISPLFHFFAPYHLPLNYTSFVKWLRDADERLPLSTKIFLGSKDRKIVEQNGVFKERDIYYMFLGSRNYSNINLLKPVPAPQTGVHMILNLLYYMGYSEIYLLGCDANFLKYYGSTRENFYDPKMDVRKNAGDTEVWGGIVNAYQYELNSHLIYQKYYNARGDRVIVNLSEESWLETFPKRNYDETVKNLHI